MDNTTILVLGLLFFMFLLLIWGTGVMVVDELLKWLEARREVRRIKRSTRWLKSK